MNLRPLGYEDRGAPFNPRRHPTGTAGTFRQPGPQPGWRRDVCGPFDDGQPDGPRWVHGRRRITLDQQVMGGVPCVTGTRIPVATVVGLVANGLTTGEIVAEYPQLTPADV